MPLRPPLQRFDPIDQHIAKCDLAVEQARGLARGGPLHLQRVERSTQVDGFGRGAGFNSIRDAFERIGDCSIQRSTCFVRNRV